MGKKAKKPGEQKVQEVQEVQEKQEKQEQQEQQEKQEQDLDFLVTQYQVLSSQQLSHNQLVWTMPSLMMVAQTFLWGLALDTELGIWMRVLFSVVSIAVGFAAWQGFERNRLIENAECRQMKAIEDWMCSRGKTVMTIQGPVKERSIIPKQKAVEEQTISPEQTAVTGEDHKKYPFSRLKTYLVWRVVMVVFLIASVWLLVLNVHQALCPSGEVPEACAACLCFANQGSCGTITGK